MCIQLVRGHHVSLNSTSTLSGIDLNRDKSANGKQLKIKNEVLYALRRSEHDNIDRFMKIETAHRRNNNLC